MNLGEITSRVQQACHSSPYFHDATCVRSIAVTVEFLANSTAPLYIHVIVQEQVEGQPVHQYRFDEHVMSVTVLEMLWALQLVYASYTPDEEILQYVETSQQRFGSLTTQRQPADAGEGQERPLSDPLASHTRSPLPEQTQRFLRTYSRHGRRIG